YLKESAAEWYEEINVEQFAPPEKQHQWQIELHTLKQQTHEKIDAYITKYKRLLSRVNTNTFLSDDYIVRMFLSRLKNNNATFVTVTVPKNLKEAIAAARRELISKKLEIIDKMALNYAAIADKLNSNNYNQSVKEKVSAERKEKSDGSESESSDTFDEFEYEDEVEELENKWDIEEKNPALYLTTIEEVPTEDDEDKKESTIENILVELIKKEELTFQQQQQAQKLLVDEKDLSCLNKVGNIKRQRYEIDLNEN
ncbi:9140_t:CDS:2, partial [Gigaspora rosea]